MLVLAIISIIFAMAIPNSEILLRMRERQELEELRRDLLFARNKAIVEARNYYVYFNSNDNKYIIKHSETSPAIKTKQLQHGIKLDMDNIVSNFQFNKNARTGKSNTIFIRDRNNNRYKLTLTPATGRVELRLVGK